MRSQMLIKTYPYEAKYQILINKRESTFLKHFNDYKCLIEYSNDMDDIYKNIEECNSNKKRKILIVFDGMIADMLSNKKHNRIVTELLIRGRKLNISLVFMTQSYFAVSKNIRLNSTHYFIIKIPNKQELQQIAFNHSSDIDFQHWKRLKIMENNWLNLMKLLKRILILTEIVYHLKNQKQISNELVEEKSYKFQDLKEKSNPNHLI